MDCTERRGRDGTSRRIALILHYDGTGFNGWQVQNSGRTVQGELERALKVLFGAEVRAVASGRTDSGVHALGQVVHFDCSGDITLQRMCAGLNGIAGKDMSVINAFEVGPDFHARFSAVQREYKYLIYNGRQHSPFIANRAMWIPSHIDLDFMKEISSHLVGEKDFGSFCKKKSSADVTTVRRIDEIEVTRWGDFIEFRILGKAFLHNMIRIIIGTMLFLMRGGKDPATMCDVLERRDRVFGGPTIPSHGLYLNRVVYDPPLESGKSAF